LRSNTPNALATTGSSNVIVATVLAVRVLKPIPKNIYASAVGIKPRYNAVANPACDKIQEGSERPNRIVAIGTGPANATVIAVAGWAP
jgi:hypothetical protein